MKMIDFAFAAGIALATAGSAQAQLLDKAAATDLSGTPALSQPFAKIQPVPRTYMGNAAETGGLRYQDKSAFGVYVSDPKLFGGINLAPNVALEAGYANLYTQGFRFVDYARLDEVNGVLGTKGFNSYLAARVNVPVNDQFSAYGKLGVAVSERVAHDRTLRATASDTDVGAYAGMGARYKVSEKAAVTAGYEQYGNSAKKWGNQTNNSGLSAKFNMGF
jgi:opacity protein-like surface antigen